MFLPRLIISPFFLLTFSQFIIVTHSESHHLAKRAFLFPQYTVLQFTYGVSAPAILPSRTINLSLAVQANFDLPYNISNFYAVTLARSAEDFDIDRHTLYQYIINVLNGLDLDGESCLLRAICELADIPLHIEEEDSLLEKIVHFVLTPSIDFKDEQVIGTRSLENSTYTFEEDLLKAEMMGKMYGSCSEHYSLCGLSLLDIISAQYKMF